MARQLSHGTKLKVGDGASVETFATVVFIHTISLPSQSRQAVDVSDHDTTDGMDFLPAALYDPGTVAFRGNLDPTAASQGYTAGAGILSLFDGATIRNWQIVDPSGVWKVSFQGFISAQGGDANSESGAGKLEIAGEIKVTGAVTYAAV